MTGPLLGGLRDALGARPRLLISTALTAVAYLALGALDAPLRIAAAWDSGAVCFLVLATVMMYRSEHGLIRKRAHGQDELWADVVVIAAATGLSLFAAGRVLSAGKDLAEDVRALHAAVGAGTILLSWLLVHTLFALHYAHLYYGEDASDDRDDDDPDYLGGLQFPEDDKPDYWDFLYFSFVVGMTAQVSDVQVTGKEMRRVTLAHGVIAFLFNTVILALSINIAASLL